MLKKLRPRWFVVRDARGDEPTLLEPTLGDELPARPDGRRWRFARAGGEGVAQVEATKAAPTSPAPTSPTSDNELGIRERAFDHGVDAYDARGPDGRVRSAKGGATLPTTSTRAEPTHVRTHESTPEVTS
ncbi:MAG: hypothetical protein R3B99_33435 [Polyangiales bacterium]